MTVAKNNKLKIKTTAGIKVLEILRITKSGIDARNVNLSGQSVVSTGFEFFGMELFWDRVHSGAIEIC